VDRAEGLLDKALAAAAERVTRGLPPFGLGAASLVSGLGYLVLRHGRGKLDLHPALAAWNAETSKRPSVAGSAPS
jgi:hypothetical protein